MWVHVRWSASEEGPVLEDARERCCTVWRATFCPSPVNELYSTKWNQWRSPANNKAEILNSGFLTEITVWYDSVTAIPTVENYTITVQKIPKRAFSLEGFSSKWCRKCQSPHPFICLLIYFSACHTQYFCWLDLNETCRDDECEIEEQRQSQANEWRVWWAACDVENGK